MLTMDLALITFGRDGINRVASMSLPEIQGVRYVVSWQNHGDATVPEALQRDDVEIYRTASHGAASNRNNAINHCKADIILFADDDIIYTADRLRDVMNVFRENPEVELATFIGTHPSPPRFPAERCRLRCPLPKGYWVSAYLIAYRRRELGDLLCHPQFGAGMKKFTGADDELFLLSAIRRGHRCEFFPINICTHPTESTGTTQSLSPGNLRAQGVYIALAYRWSWPARVVLKAWRVWRHGQSGLLRALKYLLSGSLRAPFILHRGHRYLW